MAVHARLPRILASSSKSMSSFDAAVVVGTPIALPRLIPGTCCICTPGANGNERKLSMILVLTDGLDFSPSRQIQDSLDAV